MRTAFPLLAVLLAGMPAQATAARWRSIFDGKSLSGWTPKVTGSPVGINAARSFTVRHGAIRVGYEGWTKFNGGFGHLAFKQPMSTFRLRLEYRFFGTSLPDVEAWQHSNSGIMLLGQSPRTMGLQQKFPVSLEMQLLGADRPERAPTGNLCTPGTNVVMSGKLITQHCNNSSSPVMPNGQWIRAEVEVTRSGKVTHFINGKPVLTYSAPQYDPTDDDAKPLIAAARGKLPIRRGYIYLQSEGHPVEFRNIQLMELE